MWWSRGGGQDASQKPTGSNANQDVPNALLSLFLNLGLMSLWHSVGMNKYVLSADDSMQDFEQGLRGIGYFDCVSEHCSSKRSCFMLGQSRAWSMIGDRELPLVVDWKARITIPAELAETPQAASVLGITRHLLSSLGSHWLKDIRSEARMEGYPDLARLVRQDIERGDLPNRMVFDRNLQNEVLPQIDLLRRRMGSDPDFDWRRVRVDVSV